MQQLEFSYNWNNKLECKAFTTLRLSNPEKYYIGNKLNVTLKKGSENIEYGAIQIVGVKDLYINDINSFIAHVDTGYSITETCNILRKMYSTRSINWATQKLMLILCVKIKPLKK